MENDKLVRLSDVRLIESRPDAYPEEWNDSYEKGFVDAINAVLDIPAVDAVEVRHAEWKVVEDKNYLGGWKTVCSACKYAYSNKAYHEVEEFCFCPHCGARMDGQRREDGDGT